MSPAAAMPPQFSSTTAESIACPPHLPPPNGTSSVVLKAEIAAAAEQELLTLVRAHSSKRSDGSDPAAGLIRALGKAIERELTANDPAGEPIDRVSMGKVQELVASVCEYAGTLVQTCFGAGKADNKRKQCAQEDEVRDLVKRVRIEQEDRGDHATTPGSTALVCAPGSPVKCEEIRPAEVLEIQPYDQAFHRLQDSLHELDEQREVLRKRIDALIVDHAATKEMLYKLEERAFHRLDRARARNIQFVVKLEEEWLQDPDSIAVMKEPCADCATSRKAKPPLKHPSPAKSTTTTTTTSSASDK